MVLIPSFVLDQLAKPLPFPFASSFLTPSESLLLGTAPPSPTPWRDWLAPRSVRPEHRARANKYARLRFLEAGQSRSRLPALGRGYGGRGFEGPSRHLTAGGSARGRC